MDEPISIYHVLLEGHTVGPYDRRTIVGMRIKKTLTSDHVLINAHGVQLTVADLIESRPAAAFNPNRSGSFSRVRATYSASLIETQGPGLRIPKFRGEVEARVQGDVLRIAGRSRRGLRWKDERIKIVLADVAHARIKGTRVDLWLRNGRNDSRQRIALELFTHEAAGELVKWLPAATPLPEPTQAEPMAALRSPLSSGKALGVAVFGVALVVGLVLMLLVFLLYRRY
jgi:hypothetical protein